LPFDARRQGSEKESLEQSELGKYERIVQPFGETVVGPLGEKAPASASQTIQYTEAVSLEAHGTATLSGTAGTPRLDSEIIQKHSTAPFYSDHPARRDLLNRKAAAETIATIIENVWKEDAKEEDIDRTFMVHLHGRWGSGKTSILNFLKDALLSQSANNSSEKGSPLSISLDPSWVIVEYNAWRNQNLGPAWWTLMEAVYRQARDQLGGCRRLWLILRDRLWRMRCSYARYSFAAALAVVLGLSLIWLWRASLFGAERPWFVDGLKIIGSIIGLIVAVFAFGHNYGIGSARTAKSYLELSRDPLSSTES